MSNAWEIILAGRSACFRVTRNLSNLKSKRTTFTEAAICSHRPSGTCVVTALLGLLAEDVAFSLYSIPDDVYKF
jgi:hypothetical protein